MNVPMRFQGIYPELYAVVGGSTPNYSGFFLRGVGGKAAALGVIQNDSMKRLTGSINSLPMHMHANTSGVFANSKPRAAEYVKGENRGNWGLAGVIDFDTAHMGAGYNADETRPINKAVRYLIRAR